MLGTLNDPNYLKASTGFFKAESSKKELVEVVDKLVDLFELNEDELTAHSSSQSTQSSSQPATSQPATSASGQQDGTGSQTMSLYEELQHHLDHITKAPAKKAELSRDYKAYLVRKTALTPALEKLRENLEQIKPTSVESERAFSAAGLFVGKLRTRLADNTLSMLCIIKSWLKSQIKAEREAASVELSASQS